jgi:hypothetical protein
MLTFRIILQDYDSSNSIQRYRIEKRIHNANIIMEGLASGAAEYKVVFPEFPGFPRHRSMPL